MKSRTITCALVSADTELREQLGGAVGDEAGVEIVLEVVEPIQSITAGTVENLLSLAPEVVLVDLEGAPAPGLKLAQFLLDSDPALRVVLTGPDASSDLLRATLRIGAADYLVKPIGPKDLSGALERIRRKVSPSMPAREVAIKPGAAEVHTVLGPKAGQGATTFAVGLAGEIRTQTGGKVLLVDFDLQLGDIDLHLGLTPEFDVVDLARNLHRVDAEMLSSFVVAHGSGISVLSAPVDPNKSASIASDQLGQAIRLLRRHYDHIVIDAGSPLGMAAAVATERADSVWLVARPSLDALRAAKRMLPVIHRLRGEQTEGIRFVLSMVQSGEFLSDHDLEDAVGIGSAVRLSFDSRSARKALHSGQPISAFRGPFTVSLSECTAALLGKEVPERPSLLGRILGHPRS